MTPTLRSWMHSGSRKYGRGPGLTGRANTPVPIYEDGRRQGHHMKAIVSFVATSPRKSFSANQRQRMSLLKLHWRLPDGQSTELETVLPGDFRHIAVTSSVDHGAFGER